MISKQQLLDKFNDVAAKGKKMLYETPVEILIGVMLVGATFGVARYHVERSHEGNIPLAFSEIERTTKEFSAKGLTVPPLTRQYSLSSDAAMKVFESNNIALAKDRTNETFARELETRIDPALKKHMLISEIAAEMPEDTRNALASVQKLTDATRELPAVANAFGAVWDESHVDSYHTEFYTTQSCDSKGQNCTTQIHTRQVYDYTTHTYSYNQAQGEAAYVALGNFLQKFPDLNVQERLHLASGTGAENEDAIKTSMKDRFKDKAMTAAEALGLANTWASGSNFTKYTPIIRNSEAQLNNLLPAWAQGKGTAQSTSYRTYSHSDAGPREYQIAEAVRDNAVTANNSSVKIIDGIAYAGSAVPSLSRQIRDYVDVSLHGKAGDPDKMRSQLMKSARDLYDKNFENGFDVNPFKWLMIVLYTTLGMALGGGMGAGVNWLLDKKKEAAWRRGIDITKWKPITFKKREKLPPVYKGRDEVAPQAPKQEPKPVTYPSASDVFAAEAKKADSGNVITLPKEATETPEVPETIPPQTPANQNKPVEDAAKQAANSATMAERWRRIRDFKL